MSESYVDQVANELADLALADQAASGDIAIVDQIGEILGTSSQTLQETYLTAVRVRRAEARAREILAARLSNGFKAAPKPKAAPLQGLSAEDKAAAEAAIEDEREEQIAAPTIQEDPIVDERAEIEAEIAAADARKAAQAAAKKAAAEEEARLAAAEAEKQANAPKPIAGPWDLEDAAAKKAEQETTPEPEPEPAEVRPSAPRRVTRSN